jgi:hypothetical protein
LYAQIRPNSRRLARSESKPSVFGWLPPGHAIHRLAQS